jgi:hypothetical protein
MFNEDARNRADSAGAPRQAEGGTTGLLQCRRRARQTRVLVAALQRCVRPQGALDGSVPEEFANAGQTTAAVASSEGLRDGLS